MVSFEKNNRNYNPHVKRIFQNQHVTAAMIDGL